MFSSYPIPFTHPPLSSGHISAADFFKDSPWLRIPIHRKADILIEPLYPRLGLLGGAPEGSGKMSKLAALAAARKRKECASDNAVASEIACSQDEQRSVSVSLLDRLSSSGKVLGSPESRNTRLPLRKGGRIVNRIPERKNSPTRVGTVQLLTRPESQSVGWENLPVEPRDGLSSSRADLRAKPSTFATIIIGEADVQRASTLSHKWQNVDIMSLFGPDLTEVYGFTDPSPDDVVLNAQSAAKGLCIRRLDVKYS